MKSCPTCNATYPANVAFCPRDGAPLVDAGEWAEGTMVRGKYRILAKVGQGGMGAVYKALHLRFDEVRALKVLSAELTSDPTFVKRFEQEAVVTRKLQHPNAVRMDDIDEAEDGRPFIVMEFIEGRSLRKVIEEEGPMSVPRVCGIIKQVVSALDAAHRLGMVHRDIKPDNIVLVGQGFTPVSGRGGLGPPEGAQRAPLPDPAVGEIAKVLDFGIAKVKEARLGAGTTLTKTGMVVGTPQYMSPEQAMGKRGDDLDARSDLYSLGIVMYQMLTRQLPFKADTTLELLLAHMQQPPTPIRALRPDLEIPEPVANVVMRCLEKKRELRPTSAQALIEELDRAEKKPPAKLAPTIRVEAPAEALASREAQAAPHAPPPRPAPPPPPQPFSQPSAATPPAGPISAPRVDTTGKLVPRRGGPWRWLVVGLAALIALAIGIQRFVLRPRKDIADNKAKKIRDNISKAPLTSCFLQGHSEHDPESSERTGYDKFRNELQKENYQIDSLVLPQKTEIPSDCSLLVVAGPKSDYPEGEVDTIRKWIKSGGRVFLMLDPTAKLPNLAKLLADWNVTAHNDLVIDLNPMSHLFGTGPTMPLITKYGSSPIVGPLANTATLFPLTRSFAIGKDLKAGVSVEPLCLTSPESFGVADFNPKTRQVSVTFRPGKDLRGPLPVAVAGTLRASEGGNTKEGRFVALGTSSLAANAYLGFQGNRDLIINIAKWLSAGPGEGLKGPTADPNSKAGLR